MFKDQERTADKGRKAKKRKSLDFVQKDTEAKRKKKDGKS